jgi:hypothetical protein
MHHVTRRLAVALAGTAAAAVIINRPDELRDNIVTGHAIASNAIVSSDVAHKSLLDHDLADPDGNGGEVLWPSSRASASDCDRPRADWFDADGRPVLKVERFDFHALLT